MMRTVAQIHVEVNPNSAAAAEEYRGTIGGGPGSVGSKKQVGLQLIAQLLAHLSQIRRPDLLTRFNDEFGIETEPSAADPDYPAILPSCRRRHRHVRTSER